MRTLSAEVALLVASEDYCGETPLWSPEERALYWINCEEPPALQRWNVDTGEKTVWPMPARIGGFVLKEGGGGICLLADGLYDFDPPSGSLSFRAANPLQRAMLHECVCDRQGRLWVGSFDPLVSADNRHPGGASLMRYDGTELVPVIDGFSVSNGMAVSPDGRTFYHSDCTSCLIEQWDLDPATGTLSNRREFARLDPAEGVCDGASVDTEGGYWAAVFPGGKLRRYLPDGGVDVEIRLPFMSATKAGFMGDDLDLLAITTARMFMLEPGREMLGSVYGLRPGLRGCPDARFRIQPIDGS